ncbi:hypothetical protein ACLK17_21775 [Escherichia coli]
MTYEWASTAACEDGEHQTVMMGWTGDNGDPEGLFATLLSCAASEQGFSTTQNGATNRLKI